MAAESGSLDEDEADFLQACRDWYQSSRSRARLARLEEELKDARQQAAAACARATNLQSLNCSLHSRGEELAATNANLQQQLDAQAKAVAASETVAQEELKQQLLGVQLELQAKSATAETNKELVCKLRRKNKELEGVIQKYQRFHEDDIPGTVSQNESPPLPSRPAAIDVHSLVDHRAGLGCSVTVKDEIHVKDEDRLAMAAPAARANAEPDSGKDPSAQGRRCGTSRGLDGGASHGAADTSLGGGIDEGGAITLLVEAAREPQPASGALHSAAAAEADSPGNPTEDVDQTVWDTERRPEGIVTLTQRSEATSTFRRPAQKSGRVTRSSRAGAAAETTEEQSARDGPAARPERPGRAQRKPGTAGPGGRTSREGAADDSGTAPRTHVATPTASQHQAKGQSEGALSPGPEEEPPLPAEGQGPEVAEATPSSGPGPGAEERAARAPAPGAGKSPRWRTKGSARRPKGRSFDSDLPGRPQQQQQDLGGWLKALWGRHKQQEQDLDHMLQEGRDKDTALSLQRPSGRHLRASVPPGGASSRKRKVPEDASAKANEGDAAHGGPSDANRSAAGAASGQRHREQAAPRHPTGTGATWVMGYNQDGQVNWSTAGGPTAGQPAADSLVDEDLTQPPPSRAQRGPQAAGPNQPGYKYREVVRKKADRAALRGWDCADCRRFYENAERTGDAALLLAIPECSHVPQAPPVEGIPVQRMMNEYSKHRHQHRPPETPPGFWDMGFMDSLDSRAVTQGNKHRSGASP